MVREESQRYHRKVGLLAYWLSIGFRNPIQAVAGSILLARRSLLCHNDLRIDLDNLGFVGFREVGRKFCMVLLKGTTSAKPTQGSESQPNGMDNHLSSKKDCHKLSN